MAREFAAAKSANDEKFAVILLGDELLRSALASILLSKHPAAEVIEPGSFDEALKKLSTGNHVKLVILDLSRPATGIDKVALLRRSFSATRVIVISELCERGDILAALDRGAHGFIAKSCEVNEFKKALEMVLNGMIYVPSSISDPSRLDVGAHRRIQLATSHGPTEPHLTRRQLDVLHLLTQGKSNKAICHALNLGAGTVKVHVAGVLRALNVRSRTGAAVLGANVLGNGALDAVA
jgi:DNA-binding NarL/FixJ family response regulator